MKREREKHITRLHIILFCLVVIAGLTVFFVIKINNSKSGLKYKKLEQDLVSAAKDYYKVNKMTIQEGYEIQIDMKTLIKENYIFNETTEECKNGYVIISNVKGLDGEYELEYIAYIKCGNKYKSDNYSEY